MKFLLTITFILLGQFISAQNIKGIVLQTDQKGNIIPVFGAYIKCLNQPEIYLTDSNGIFSIPLSKNASEIVVSHIGFKPDTIFVGDKKYIQIVLKPSNMLKEVNITIEKRASEISFIDPWKTTIMNEKELFKAACCNLSESFETNPSVDVNLADAVTGTKQIQMLGLSSQYTQLTQEMIPGARGLAVNYGNTFTPGTWINSIQLTKGIGSVVTGFEGIAGMINTELHKPDVKEKMYFNAYANEGGRIETNLILAKKISTSFSHSVLLHSSLLNIKTDNNQDGFLDNPLGYQLNAAYRFKFDKGTGFVLQGGIFVVSDEKTGGQLEFDAKKTSSDAYGTQINSSKKEGWLKMGYTFPRKIYKSLGLQFSGTRLNLDSYFGNNIYEAAQNSLYVNLIFQSIIHNTNHKYRTGFSFLHDDYSEFLSQSIGIVNDSKKFYFNRKEQVPGIFFEYTYSYLTKFTLVAGQRLDYNNLYGTFYTPRLHTRLALNKTTVLRASLGRGQRTANIIAENTGVLVSSRHFVFNLINQSLAYGLQPEVAWNYGLSFTKDFKLNYRKGTFGIDWYYTKFQNQIVVDRDYRPNQVKFYNLNGNSFSNSIQLQLDYEPIKRLEMRIAYRFYDVRTTYEEIGEKEVPLIASHRAFFNMDYTTKNKWNFDFTYQWIGPKRLPSTAMNPPDKQVPSFSESYLLLNAQVSKSMFNKKFDAYLGIENILDFKQTNPIIDAQNPFGNHFDASMIWGPVFGRMIYAGIRLKI